MNFASHLVEIFNQAENAQAKRATGKHSNASQKVQESVVCGGGER
jgi:hypothetical protein